VFRHLAAHLLHVGHVGRAAVAGRGAHGDEDDLGEFGAFLDGAGEVQAARRHVLAHQLLQAVLVDGHVELLEHLDLVLVVVHAENVMTPIRKTGAGDQSDVSGSHHGDIHALDIRDASALGDLCRRVQPESVLLLAAYREPDFCEDHPEEARRLNVEPARTLRACLPLETHLTLISTDYVFDGLQPPYHETSPRHAVSVYGQTKCEAEDVLAGRPNTLVLRVPLLIGGGPTLKDCGFIGQIVETLRRPERQVQDDVLVRFPTWTRDVAAALAFLVGASRGRHLSLQRPAGRHPLSLDG
jgi:dTDP-4-dehydrorhamnose reductase